MDLKAIKRRCEQATPGPWETRSHSSGWYEVRTSATMPLPKTTDFLEMPDVVGNFKREGDAEFVAAARRDVARLVRELELANTRLDAIWQWASGADGSPAWSPGLPRQTSTEDQCKAMVRSLFDPNAAQAFLGTPNPEQG